MLSQFICIIIIIIIIIVIIIIDMISKPRRLWSEINFLLIDLNLSEIFL